MLYRRFGRTNINMPVISVGTMRFQTSWNRGDPVNPDSVTNLEKIVQKALDSGMNHFETAHGYGTSEAELGAVLPNYDRDSLIIQTKIAPAETVKEFLDTFEDSMNTLKVDHLDLLAVHGINNKELLEMTIRKNGIMDACEKLKAQGRVRHIGFSSHAKPEIITEAIRTDRFEYVNLWHSYIYQFNAAPIEEATKRDMGVFIISPNDKGGMLFKPPQKLCDLTAPLSPMMFNDIFILSNPNIHTISCGAAVSSDFDEHIGAVDKLDEHSQLVKEIASKLDRQLENIFDPDWISRRYEGLPDQPNTPGQMNIFIIVWLWNLVKAFDLIDFAKYRFNLMGNAGHWFAGCKPETFKDIDKRQLRDSLKHSPFADRVMEIIEQSHVIMKAEEVKRLGRD